MVTRCGFYVKDNRIFQRNVYIDWNDGFDTEAKRKYIRRIQEALGPDVGKIADVTTASPDFDTRALSPFFIKDEESGLNLESLYKKMEDPDDYLIHYIYITHLDDKRKKTIMQYDCYSDVFHNPEKRALGTQAFSIAIYRLMVEQSKENVLKSLKAFTEWLQNQEIIVEE